MKVLFAVSSESISDAIVKKYQKEYKEILSYKNVYYFNAILKEIQKDKTYDRIIISEDLEAFSSNNYEAIDKFIFDKLDDISDEAQDIDGNETSIILICSDRHTPGSSFLVKLFGIGVYNALLGSDRSMDNVCKLIKKTRVKKEAKIYYKIDAEDVNYSSNNGNEVSELEIQNILTHFKKLGRNTDKYAESFNSIAVQYTEDQLKIVINCLPNNVKAVLENECQRYQEIMSVNGVVQRVNSQGERAKEARKQTGIKIDMIDNQSNQDKMSGPIVIPSTIRKAGMKNAKKVAPEPVKTSSDELRKRKVVKRDPVEVEEDDEDEILTQPVRQPKVQKEAEPVKPKYKKVINSKGEVIIKKLVPKAPKIEETEEKRTKKAPIPVRKKKDISEDEDLDESFLPGLDEDDFEEQIMEDTIEDDIEEEEEDINLVDFDEEDDSDDDTFEDEEVDDFEEDDDSQELDDLTNMLDDSEDDEEYTEEVDLPGLDDLDDLDDVSDDDSIDLNLDDDLLDDEEDSYSNKSTAINSIKPKVDYSMSSLNSLLTKDKKIVAFLGSTKNGTSFLINNLAALFSSNGININTAILDMTKNKNSYYLYTNNEEELRKKAYNSISKLQKGFAEGIKVNKNLSVYTALPNDGKDYSDAESILSTLVQNHSLVLIDCDFDTPPAYFASCQEIYLVQSMDILTIQPLTAFLRDLKSQGVLESEKVRVVINKEIKVRSLTTKAIIGGMSFYNDPSMSFMTELFNKDTVTACTIPFEDNVYSKYLESLVTCNISINGYSKTFVSKLKNLSEMVYPLVGKPNYGSSKTVSQPNFGNNMDSALNRMKKQKR